MKLFCLIIYGLLFVVNTAYSQSPCSTGVRIQSPVVERPSETQVIASVDCNNIRINWKGTENQTYFINTNYTDNNTNAVMSNSELSIICDYAGNCTTLLPLKSGQRVSWTIQAVSVIDGRTFYSYPLHGSYAGCNQDIVAGKTVNELIAYKSGANKRDDVLIEPRLTVYPNPATGELIIKWSSAYKGPAKLTMLDASGKAVKLFDLQKSLPDYLDRVPVNTLSPGLYFIQIKTQDGKSLSTRFMKN